jgi:TusA-related sulfurtransferase
MTSIDVVPSARLDTVGLYCPVPILKTARKIREIGTGQVLEVLSDDPVILEDMPAWCASNGHEYLGVDRDGDELHLFVRRLR